MRGSANRLLRPIVGRWYISALEVACHSASSHSSFSANTRLAGSCVSFVTVQTMWCGYGLQLDDGPIHKSLKSCCDKAVE